MLKPWNELGWYERLAIYIYVGKNKYQAMYREEFDRVHIPQMIQKLETFTMRTKKI